MAISMFEAVKLGVVDFWVKKLRNLITIIGIVLGTMSIIVILSIVKGMQERSLSIINEHGGLRRIQIFRSWSYQNTLNLSTTFTLREFEFLRDNIPNVEAITTRVERWGRPISNGPNLTFTHLWGTLPDAQIILDWTVEEGRFLQHLDYREANDVIVLGSSMREQLFGPRNPIGQFVTIEGRRLQVIGIMEHRIMDLGNLNFGQENPLEWMNRISFIPLSTMIIKMGHGDNLDNIDIRAIDEKRAVEILPVINELLLDLRRGEPVFQINSHAENAQNTEMNIMFTIIFYFVSSISLLVGGIVIMNILLASIKERTREIGIRITVGARQIDIFLQFLVQAVIITFSGGVVGVFAAMAILEPVAEFLSMPTLLDFDTVIVALCVSVVVGLFFGIYPAIKASKLDPVKALRVD
ncbi:MAG: ABC transporter permease [Candidatus Cloacimonetes bacterium]|nr:ABC transporter permease [Candidatus Cloacimonadota bacterium]